MKKIVIIGPAFPYRGGNSLFVSHVYDVLKDKFEVKVINYKLLYPSLLFPGTTQLDKSGKSILKAPNERIVNSINPFNWIAAANKIKSENAGIIIFDWWHPFFGPAHFGISSLLKKFYKGKILFITENVISHEANLIDKILTKIGLKNARSFLALSNDVIKDLKPLAHGRKIYKSELPIYDCYSNASDNEKVTRSSLGINENAKLLLFFGYVRKYKGLDILINTLPALLKNDPEFHLLIVGEFYDDPKDYTDLIERLDLNKNVTIVNQFVPNEKVAEYYEISHVVVLPYRSATQSGILNVAYGTRKPVIITDVGGLGEFVDDGETGIVVEKPEPEFLEKAILKFFELKPNVDFESNIDRKIKSNEFYKLPQLMEKIIEEIGE